MNNKKMNYSALLLSASILLSSLAVAQTEEPTLPPRKNDSSLDRPMTQSKMISIIKQLDEKIEVKGNTLSFVYDEVNITLISDVTANRMRMITPVVEAAKMSDQQIIASLASNYHLALDARYAIGNGILFSSYIHPLRELTKSQLLSAVRQVATLSKTFGTTYTSGELTFGLQKPEEDLIDI